jgi:hypothetical protein
VLPELLAEHAALPTAPAIGRRFFISQEIHRRAPQARADPVTGSQ